MTPRWTRRPEGSNWGEFGEDDQLGRLNLLTPERRRAAALEVKEGRAFALSLPLDLPSGEYALGPRVPPQLSSTPLGHNNRFAGDWPDIVSDDYAVLALQYPTQWDAFSHHGSMFDLDGDGQEVACYYNGFRAGRDVVGSPDGSTAPFARALGIETLAETGVQGRGVLVDLHREVGSEYRGIDVQQLTRIIADQGVVIETGDILCLHTGLTKIVSDAGGSLTSGDLESCAYLDATDPGLLKWVAESGISALVADNLAIERFSLHPDAEARNVLPLHDLCLFRQGIPLGELWYLGELAAWLKANGRSRFLLTAPPLRLPGAVGSPVMGVATV